MCCLLTCCGWLVDGVQRCWSFSMACLIGLAVCWALIIASSAGVALGYNYSLAEFVELKATNVSVFMRRGVFDDVIEDENQWRRSGSGSLSEVEEGAPGESAKRRAGVEDVRSGERSYVSTADPTNPLYSFDSGDHQRYEGALLKLTATTNIFTSEDPIVKMQNKAYVQDNTLEQMNAVSNLLNRRKFGQQPSSNEQVWNFPTPLDNSRTTLSELGHLKAIQDLLTEKKMMALKMASNARTFKSTREYEEESTEDPAFANARRMGVQLGSPIYTRNIFDSDFQAIKEMMNPTPPKWYTARPKDATTVLPRGPLLPSIIIPATEAPGPLIHTASPYLSQEEFRRAMQDDSFVKVITEGVGVPTRTNFVPPASLTSAETYSDLSRTSTDTKRKLSVISLAPGPGGDSDLESALNQDPEYDIEDIKGAPVRRRRKRDKRFIVKSTDEAVISTIFSTEIEKTRITETSKIIDSIFKNNASNSDHNNANLVTQREILKKENISLEDSLQTTKTIVERNITTSKALDQYSPEIFKTIFTFPKVKTKQPNVTADTNFKKATKKDFITISTILMPVVLSSVSADSEKNKINPTNKPMDTANVEPNFIPPKLNNDYSHPSTSSKIVRNSILAKLTNVDSISGKPKSFSEKPISPENTLTKVKKDKTKSILLSLLANSLW